MNIEKMDPNLAIKIGAGLAVVAVAYYVLTKGIKVAGGLLSGNNAITKNQTDAQGNPTDAYVGGGPVATIGAAVNTATGGNAASFGEWLGSTVYDLTHTTPPVNPAAASESATNFGIKDPNAAW